MVGRVFNVLDTEVGNQVLPLYTWDTAPTNGVGGTYAGTAVPGALLETPSALYQNQGTQASPNWVDLAGGGTAVPLPFFGTIPSTGWTRPALATFDTWLNQGDATASDGVGGLPLTIISDTASANTTANLTAKLKSIGDPPWTITCAMAGSANVAGDLSAQWWAPIILNNSADGAAVAMIWLPTNGGWYVVHYTTTVPGTGVTEVGNGGSSAPAYFSWARVINDGTNLTFQISDEGQEWMTFYEEAADALVASFDTVGFGMDLGQFAAINQGPQYFQSAKLWQWID